MILTTKKQKSSPWFQRNITERAKYRSRARIRGKATRGKQLIFHSVTLTKGKFPNTPEQACFWGGEEQGSKSPFSLLFEPISPSSLNVYLTFFPSSLLFPPISPSSQLFLGPFLPPPYSVPPPSFCQPKYSTPKKIIIQHSTLYRLLLNLGPIVFFAVCFCFKKFVNKDQNKKEVRDPGKESGSSERQHFFLNANEIKPG